MAKLEDGELRLLMRDLEGWKHLRDAIHKDFTFPGFKSAIAFVNRIAEVAEKMDHHPDVDIRYTKVTCSLSTHSAGGITQKDFKLAEEIDNRVIP